MSLANFSREECQGLPTWTRLTRTPTITIASPAVGATLGVTTTVTWSLSDADGDEVTSFLEYTHNGAVDILPLTDGLEGSSQSVVINSSLLPASTGGELRVRATDGLRTSISAVGGLSVGPNKAPLAAITSPVDGARFRTGVRPILIASAHDLEDGDLPDTAIVWSSNIDGSIGVGELIEPTLSVGTHIITLTVTDTQGAQSVDQITIIQS